MVGLPSRLNISMELYPKVLKKERFVSMVLKFGVSKSATAFKIALSKLIDNYLRIKDSLLSPHCF